MQKLRSDAEIHQARKELDHEEELLKLMRQLYHHHMSQAKPISSPCSKQYNRSLAEQIKKFAFPK